MREPQSKLSRAANGQAQPLKSEKLAKAVEAVRVLEPFTIPRLNLPAVMTLVPYARVKQIEADVIEEMERRLAIALNATTELHYELERGTRFLADAVLDAEEVAQKRYTPLAPLAHWQDLDPDIIGDCWRIYADVRAAYDPISVELTKEDIELIEAIVKKNDEPSDLRLRLLRTIGVRKLSSYMLSSAYQLSSLATPDSSPTPSSATS